MICTVLAPPLIALIDTGSYVVLMLHIMLVITPVSMLVIVV